MARQLTGSVYPVKGGYGIRWRQAGKREHYCPVPPFRTKTDARRWFDETAKPRLRRHAPNPTITFDAFAGLFLDGHEGAASTVATLRDRLKPARARFGGWTLRDLEAAPGEIKVWRQDLPAGSRYRHTSALRQCLEAARRWRYISRNPAVEAGKNPQPRGGDIQPFTHEQLDALAEELGPRWAPVVIFAAETGLRTEEWIALERRDLNGDTIAVQRKFAKGKLTPYPKTTRSLRAVPLTPRAQDAIAQLPPRLDTTLLFPAPEGGHIGLDTWRSRYWYPALAFAGLEQRGPYALRHTFATWALRAGVPIFELARVMGTSPEMIHRRYGHLATDSLDIVRSLLAANGR